MNSLGEILPFLIPAVIMQFILLAYVIRHILTHNHYKRGSRTLWLVIVIIFMNYLGPILYLLLGKEDE